MRPDPLRLALVIAAATGLLVASVAAETVIMAPIKDNTIYSEHGSLSNGVGAHIFAGNTGQGATRRALLAFPVADSIPPGATITSASLRLSMSRTSDGTPESVALHAVLRDWGEGTSNALGNEGQGTDAVAGDATWTFAFFNTQTWGNAGGDLAASSSATQTVGGVGAYVWSSAQMAADVQAWVDVPANNFGWILIGGELESSTARRFDSRQHSTANNRPRLTVDYAVNTATPPPATAPLRVSAYPNPFNPTTTLLLTSASPARVDVGVYDPRGRLVRVLADDLSIHGTARLRWDGRDAHGRPLATGIYVYRVGGGPEAISGKLVLIE
jgi:hypothetical protein